MLVLRNADLPQPLTLQQHAPNGNYIPKEDLQAVQDSINEAQEYVREGNVLIFEAKQRKGKTLGATIWAVDSYRHGRQVYSTIEFKFPHKKLDFFKLKLGMQDGEKNELINAHIFVDELNFYLDARASMSKANRDFSAFLLQTKKQGCIMTGTTHAIKSLEMRFRDNYDYSITPEVYPKYPGKPKYIRMLIRNGPAQANLSKVITMNCEAYLRLYDTRSIYNPFQSMPSAAPGGKNPSVHHPRLPKFTGE
jgi:hypothetical protein